MKQKKQKWQNGDLFLIPLNNGLGVLGQVLDLQMPNVVRCVIFEETYLLNESIQLNNYQVENDKVISLIACTREQLDFSVWKIIATAKVQVPVSKFPNEKYRCNGWVGSIIYDAAIVEEFVNAFYCLCFWDDWANPNYLDELLISIDKKPKQLLFKSI